MRMTTFTPLLGATNELFEVLVLINNQLINVQIQMRKTNKKINNSLS